jgi:predicted DNA-binding mobile mystery protein A
VPESPLNNIKSPGSRPELGWIRHTRQSLGLKVKDLAQLTGLSPQTVTETEQREKEGKITLRSLHKMAEAMGCELVYSFVPKNQRKPRPQLPQQMEAFLNSQIGKELESQALQIKDRLEGVAKKFLEKKKDWL